MSVNSRFSSPRIYSNSVICVSRTETIATVTGPDSCINDALLTNCWKPIFCLSFRCSPQNLSRLTTLNWKHLSKPIYLKHDWRRPRGVTWSTHCPPSPHPTLPPTAPSCLHWTPIWMPCSWEATASLTPPWRKYVQYMSTHKTHGFKLL